MEKLNHSESEARGYRGSFDDVRGSFQGLPRNSQVQKESLPPETEEEEGMRLIEAVRRREAGCTKLFWNIPGSGFDTAYLRKAVYLHQLEECVTSGDEARRAAVIAAMKASLR
jgi:hypothetical protein